MSKWDMVRLGDVALINMGQSPKSSSYNEDGEGIPFYQGNADFGALHPKLRYYCSEPTKIASANDVLLSVRAPIGALNIATERCCIGRGLAAITSIEDLTDYKFLYYVLMSKYDELNMRGTGSTFKAINKQNLSEMMFPLPPLEVQKQIAKTLDIASEIINLRKKQLEELDNLIKSIFYDMFGDPVLNEKGWKVRVLNDLLLDIKYGTSTPPTFSDVGYKFIRATNIKSGRIVQNDMRYISLDEANKIQKCKLKEGDLIIVRSGVNSGDTCVINKYYAGHYGGYDLIVSPNKQNINPSYLNELINTRYREAIIKPLTRRAAQPHLNAEQIKNLLIILPPIELQNKFASIITKIEKQKALVQKSIDESQYLFDSLMSKYFD